MITDHTTAALRGGIYDGTAQWTSCLKQDMLTTASHSTTSPSFKWQALHKQLSPTAVAVVSPGLNQRICRPSLLQGLATYKQPQCLCLPTTCSCSQVQSAVAATHCIDTNDRCLLHS